MPFRVAARHHEIVDAGTAFEVALVPASIEVAVAEGSVVVDPGQAAVQLEPGERAALGGDGRLAVSRISANAVGQWRQGRMSYRDEPLQRVVAELSAAIGQAITVDPALARRRFTGTLLPATLRDRPDELAALLDVRVRRNASGWELHAW